MGLLPRALPAAGTRWWPARPHPRRLRAACQAFPAWGRWPLSSERTEEWVAPGEAEAGPSGGCPRRALPSGASLPHMARSLARSLTHLIDVVKSCSPGPGLSRARRGTGTFMANVASLLVLPAGPSPLLCRPWVAGGRQGCGLRPDLGLPCLVVSAGPGSCDAADTLASSPARRPVSRAALPRGGGGLPRRHATYPLVGV